MYVIVKPSSSLQGRNAAVNCIHCYIYVRSHYGRHHRLSNWTSNPIPFSIACLCYRGRKVVTFLDSLATGRGHVTLFWSMDFRYNDVGYPFWNKVCQRKPVFLPHFFFSWMCSSHAVVSWKWPWMVEQEDRLSLILGLHWEAALLHKKKTPFICLSPEVIFDKVRFLLIKNTET